MRELFIKISSTMAALALGLALAGDLHAQSAAPEAQPAQLKGTDLSPAALQQADALIEKYVRPVAEPEPAPVEQRAIDSAMRLLKSGQATKGQSAIQQFLEVGPAALGELRRLAAAAPAEDTTGSAPTDDAYLATMATIIIRRIETAQRQPILDELTSLGDNARAVLSLKLDKNEAAGKRVESRIDAATAALIKAAANVTLDSPAVAAERDALALAQAAQRRVQARHDMLVELRRLLAPKPPAQVAALPQEQQQPATPPANILDIQPISPQTGSFSFYNLPDMWPGDPYNQSWPPFFFGQPGPGPVISPHMTNPPFVPSNRPFVPNNPPFVPSNPPFQPKSAPFNPTPPFKH